jgi:hypothetical protein
MIVAIHQPHYLAWLWKSAVTCFGKAPYFRQLRDLDSSRSWPRGGTAWRHLTSASLDELGRAFGIRSKIVLRSCLVIAGLATERLIGNLSEALGDSMASGESGRKPPRCSGSRGFRDPNLASKTGLALAYARGLGFIPDLSRVDLLFNEGPHSLDRLTRPVPRPGTGCRRQSGNVISS